MSKKIKNGTRKTIKEKRCVYYDGYWIRHYDVQTDSLATKKQTIDQLTKRVFHHLEPGINTPGNRLEEIRAIYQNETNPARKRVKGAMLAGALLNRGSDILTMIVELEEAGVSIEPDNELLRTCGECFMEALELGNNIKLATGGEGIDELWGEPFKAFSMPMDAFFESRYIKIAQTMNEIDQITEILIRLVNPIPGFKQAKSRIMALGHSAKLACETLRSDPDMFEIWPEFVAAKESLEDYVPDVPDNPAPEEEDRYNKALELLHEGGVFLVNLATVRVPIPESMNEFLKKCSNYKS
ncbi:MAG: hypothetical protein HY356_04630 [Gammaproteobacteria bacterium]|nr:hypothetical protein [Gammaproteobacteria bacterium]